MSRGGYAPGNLDGNGFIKVSVEDQTTRIQTLKFGDSQGATTLSVEGSVGDTSVTLADATGFVDGNDIAILSLTTGGYFAQQVGAAVGSVITLDTPIDTVKAIGSLVVRLNTNMNVLGTLADPVIFQIGPVGVGRDVDLTRISGYIQDGSAMDDALFGGITALTNGIVLRRNNGIIENIWNAKTNSDLALITCGAFDYTEKAPSGKFGARFCDTFAGQGNHGVAVLLEGDDTLELLVQDDLRNLEIFRMLAEGHNSFA